MLVVLGLGNSTLSTLRAPQTSFDYRSKFRCICCRFEPNRRQPSALSPALICSSAVPIPRLKNAQKAELADVKDTASQADRDLNGHQCL